MKNSIFTTVVLLLGATLFGNAHAEEYLNSTEINKLVSGNSISGVYDGNNFKQNIHSDGIVVVYIAKDKVYNIPWIANDRDEYCEYWGEEWGWSCFKFKPLAGDKLTAVKVGDDKKALYTWTWTEGFIDINP